jgi:hypothetical protein
MTILFPADEEPYLKHRAISFYADMNNQRIRCAVKLTALENYFGCDISRCLDTFRDKRSVIEGVAERLINQQRFEQDGSILICSQDF